MEAKEEALALAEELAVKTETSALVVEWGAVVMEEISV